VHAPHAGAARRHPPLSPARPAPPPRRAGARVPPATTGRPGVAPQRVPDTSQIEAPDGRAVQSTGPAIRVENWDLLGQPLGLRVDDVSREFKSGDVSVAALEDVSFEVAPGEFVAITGPSGC